MESLLESIKTMGLDELTATLRELARRDPDSLESFITELLTGDVKERGCACVGAMSARDLSTLDKLARSDASPVIRIYALLFLMLVGDYHDLTTKETKTRRDCLKDAAAMDHSPAIRAIAAFFHSVDTGEDLSLEAMASFHNGKTIVDFCRIELEYLNTFDQLPNPLFLQVRSTIARAFNDLKAECRALADESTKEAVEA